MAVFKLILVALAFLPHLVIVGFGFYMFAKNLLEFVEKDK